MPKLPRLGAGATQNRTEIRVGWLSEDPESETCRVKKASDFVSFDGDPSGISSHSADRRAPSHGVASP